MVTDEMVEKAVTEMARQDITFANCDMTWQRRAIRGALEAALSAAEPVRWMWEERRFAESDIWDDMYDDDPPAPHKQVRNIRPLYAAPPAPPAPSVAVKALDFDAVYVIPREMTDDEWADVKYNVDRKANPDIELWRIKEVVKYANFIAGHRGRSALSAQVQDVAGWQPIDTAPKDGTQFLAFDKGSYFNCWWYDNGYGEQYWMDEADSEPNPWHWMPLPAAPAKQEGGTNE